MSDTTSELRAAGSAVQRVKIAMLAIIGRKFGTR
jgi:hypothetical protein